MVTTQEIRLFAIQWGLEVRDVQQGRIQFSAGSSYVEMNPEEALAAIEAIDFFEDASSEEVIAELASY